MSEIIGWELTRLDENWSPNETFNPTGLQRPPYEKRPRSFASGDGISIEELQGPPAQTMVEESNNAEIVAVTPPEPTSDQMPLSAIFLGTTSDNENSTAVAGESGRQTRTSRSRHQVPIPPFQQELAPGKLLTYVFFWKMSQHAQQLFQLERPQNWDPVCVIEPRTQLDLDDWVPVPIGYRMLYYRLMYDIRRFPYNGLLAPASTNLVPEDERFCNHHPEGITTVCSRVFHHFRGMTHHARKEFFHPYKLPPFLTQQCPYKETSVSRKVVSEDKLRKHYDRWYWKLLMAQPKRFDTF